MLTGLSLLSDRAITSSVVTVSDVPKNMPPFSMVNSEQVIFPFRLPLLRISIFVANISPSKLPLILALLAYMVPLTYPVGLIVTSYSVRIVPKIIPSTWILLARVSSPPIRAPSAMIVGAPCLLVVPRFLSKSPIVFPSDFQIRIQSYLYSNPQSWMGSLNDLQI